MKKLSFFLMAMLFSVMSFAVEQTATISFADVAQRTTYTTEQQVWEQNGLVVTNDKASSTNNVGDYSNPARFYKSSALTIKCTLGNIIKIVVNCNKASYATDLVTSVGAEAVADSTAVTITPTAESDTYSIAALAGQVRVNDITVTYEAAAEEKPEVTVPTNAELWEAFKPYYNTYYGLNRADQPIDKVSTFASAKMQQIMTDEASEYKWLGDYVLGVAAGQGVTLSTDMAAANEGGWRWAVHAFFNATTGANGAAGTDFTEAGKPENWGPYYLAAQTPDEPEIEWIEMPLEISNLTTMEMPVEGVTYLQLMGRNDMAGADVMLFLNNYTGEEKAYEVNVENSFMTFGGTELTVMDGSITKSVDPELGDVFAGIVHASAVEEGVTLYVALDLKMYAQPAIKIAIEDVEITVNEESAIAFFKATWEGSPLQVEVSGFEEVESKEYSECWLSIGDDVNWVDAAAGPATITIKDGVASLEGTFTSFATGKTYEVILSGKLPVTEEPAEEPAEKPVITAAELEQITGDEDIFHFYLSQGVAVDKNPESPYYGYTYVTAATDGADDGSSDRADTQKRGIFVFDAELNSLNPDNVGFLPANADSLMTDVSRQAMHRIAINPVNNHVVFCYNVAGASAIWSMDPANLAGDAVNLIEGLAITKANAFCFDAEGTLYVMDNANTSDGGTIVKVVNGELDTVAKNTIWGVQDISLASDGRGGLWVAQNRWAVDAFAVLSHVNAAGEVDFAVTGSSPDEVKALFPNDFNASYRGQCAYNVEKDILAFGGNKVVTLFYVTYDAAGVPSIAKIGATPAIGSNIDGIDFYANGDLAVVSASAERFKKFAVKYQIEIEGVVKRAIQYNDATIVLTHEENGTAHLYKVVDGVAVAELSQKGVIAVDPENAGDFLAISDIALTEDGKLVATNKIVCQASDNEVDAGYKRGELRAYIWNDLAGAPSLWFTSKMSSNWYRSIQGNTIAYKGTSTNGTLFTTGITATGVKFRYSVYNVIDGVYTDPAVNDSEHYHFTKGSAQTTDVLGANYQLVASPLAATNWILDAELVDPFEIVDPLTYNTEVTANPALAIDLGKKYNGTSIVTVGEQHLMVAPYATAEGLLAGVKVVDITAGLAAATEVATANLAAAVEATAAATAVAVAENVLTITLVADATIHTLEVVLEKEPEIEWIEMPLEIANLTTEEMEVEGAKYLLLQGRDDMNGAEVMLFLNNYTGEEKAYEVNVENSFMTFGGTELTIMDGSITKSVDPELGDVFAGIVHASAVEEGVTLYFALDLKMYAQPAIKIAIEDVEITVNEESATAFFKATWESSPLQVEVSGFEEVESKEYSECWLSIGDNVNWVDAAAGPAAITIKDGVASLVGTFTSYATGKTYEVTLSGKLPQDPGSGLDNVQVDAKAVKVIKNGMLIINRDGKEYNVQGATLK